MRPWLHRFALFTALATLALIGLGGLVTSHGVGMAVPDWPNTYGYNMFFFPFSMWVGGIFYEHSHRLFASGVGLLTVILVLWLHGRRAQPLMRWGGLLLLLAAGSVLTFATRRWQDAVVLGATGAVLLAAGSCWPHFAPARRSLRRLGLIAVAGVVLQGILGGLRVTALKDEIGIFHALLAQLFFCLLCAISLFTGKWWAALPGRALSVTGRGLNSLRGVSWAFAATTLLVLAQLGIGATMRHAHAGLAIPDFPLAYGRWWPDMTPKAVERYNQQRLEITAVNPITAGQVGLQMAHRLMALAILVSVSVCAAWALRRLGFAHPVSRLGLVWLGLVLAQVILGAWTIWSNKAADVATLHVITGALSLATGAIACIVSFRLSLAAAAITDSPINAAGSSRARQLAAAI